MPLSVRRIAASCHISPPISLFNDILGHGDHATSSVRDQLTAMQAECMPWEVLRQNGAPLSTTVMAVHTALLPVGRYGQVLYFGGYNDEKAYLFDVQTEAEPIETSNLPATNMFCAGHAFLANGRLLVGGGQGPRPPEGHRHFHGTGAGGEVACWIYDPWETEDDVWKKAADLQFQPASTSEGGGRWYPTLLTLANGEVLAVGGHPHISDTFHGRHNNNVPERYSTRNDRWVYLPEIRTAEHDVVADSYPRIHLLPDGTVFFATLVEERNRYLDAHAGVFVGDSFEPGDLPSFYRGNAQDSDSSSVLLPLLPGDGYTPRVLVCGHTLSYRVNLGAEEPEWNETDPRDGAAEMRRDVCATMLPDGKVFMSGGSTGGGDDHEANQNAVHEGEIYDPGIDWSNGAYDGEDDWTTVEPATVPRHYHGVAILMTNGVVWTGGSNGAGGNEWEPRIEVYRPPYLAKLGRPEITDCPESLIYGQRFNVETPQAASIERVILLRNGSMTHAFNCDQRYIALEFERRGDDRLRVTAPPWGGVAPPGYYMLWILNGDDAPCRLARFVQLSALSVRIVAAGCGISTPISLRDDILGSHGNALRRRLIDMQRECLT